MELSFKPSFLLESINLARKSLADITQRLNSLSDQVAGFMRVSGDQEKQVTDLKEADRTFAQSLLARETDFTSQISQVGTNKLNNDELKVAELIFDHYSIDQTKHAIGSRKKDLILRIVNELSNEKLNGDEMVEILQREKDQIQNIQNNPDIDRSLKNLFVGVSMTKNSQGKAVKEYLKADDKPYSLLKDLYRDQRSSSFTSEKEKDELAILSKYKFMLISLLIGTISNRIFSKRPGRDISRNMFLSNPEFENFRILTRAIAHFAKQA